MLVKTIVILEESSFSHSIYRRGRNGVQLKRVHIYLISLLGDILQTFDRPNPENSHRHITKVAQDADTILTKQ